MDIGNKLIFTALIAVIAVSIGLHLDTKYGWDLLLTAKTFLM